MEKCTIATNKVLWIAGGVGVAAAAGYLIWRRTRTKPATELAEQLTVAWSDSHTVV